MTLKREQLIWAYEMMVLIRRLEESLMDAVAQGKPTYVGHPYSGQEAVAVGVCANLNSNDYLFSSHRAKGWALAKGLDLNKVVAEMWGKVTGASMGRGGEMQMADATAGYMGGNVVVASNLPLACGTALAAKLRGKGQVTVCQFGDGASNQGAFHESLNLSAIWKLPVVWLCENNRYAESTPVEYAVSVPNIAERAKAYNIPGVTVDGQDVLAVYDAAGQAVKRARTGEGPTLVEAKTYRYYGHFFGDKTTRYRTQEEEAAFRAKDCILQFKKKVLEQELLTPKDLESADQRVEVKIAGAMKFAEESRYPTVEELLGDVYV
ncbi:MAG: thiamine pyrophosphate-dependent dehydrogenase E1 component subunit alpha [Chloroflexi bacterium]|nr:thiamine pyrophosphate-dependent dehydrogenase E1 component subunit alpha [Chloroflexota bacterium]